MSLKLRLTLTAVVARHDIDSFEAESEKSEAKKAGEVDFLERKLTQNSFAI